MPERELYTELNLLIRVFTFNLILKVETYGQRLSTTIKLNMGTFFLRSLGKYATGYSIDSHMQQTTVSILEC